MKRNSMRLVFDTTVVAERAADTLYLEQKIVMNKLDSLIEVTKK